MELSACPHPTFDEVSLRFSIRNSFFSIASSGIGAGFAARTAIRWLQLFVVQQPAIRIYRPHQPPRFHARSLIQSDARIRRHRATEQSIWLADKRPQPHCWSAGYVHPRKHAVLWAFADWKR